MKAEMQCGVVALLLAAGAAHAGAKMEIGGDSNSWAEVGVLAQPHFLYSDDTADQEDFYLRRCRLLFTGQFMDGVKMFVDTDAPSAGRNGTATAHIDVQDAFLDARLLKTDLGEHWVKTGLILLPFSFENRAGAGSTLGVDYDSEAIKMVNTFCWRDYGAELHGNVSDRFSYIVGAFDGYDSAEGTKNPEADLRVTGHAAFNLLGKAETDWFYTQERLGKGGPYLSIGAGYDQQNDATLRLTPVAGTTNVTQTIIDSTAWVVDFQSGFQAGPVGLTLNGGWYEWDNATFDGNTVFVDGGVRIEKTQATVKYCLQNPDAGQNVADTTVGLNYFLKGHTLKCGAEYRWGDSPTTVLVGLQFLR